MCIKGAKTKKNRVNQLKKTLQYVQFIRLCWTFQKLSLCFCCLMMILIKSCPQDDYSLLICHLLVLHESRYPIYDRETLKMIDILRDSCNSVKDKILPMGDTWTLFSRDIEVYFKICLLYSLDHVIILEKTTKSWGDYNKILTKY